MRQLLLTSMLSPVTSATAQLPQLHWLMSGLDSIKTRAIGLITAALVETQILMNQALWLAGVMVPRVLPLAEPVCGVRLFGMKNAPRR